MAQLGPWGGTEQCGPQKPRATSTMCPGSHSTCPKSSLCLSSEPLVIGSLLLSPVLGPGTLLPAPCQASTRQQDAHRAPGLLPRNGQGGCWGTTLRESQDSSEEGGAEVTLREPQGMCHMPCLFLLLWTFPFIPFFILFFFFFFLILADN